MKKIIYFSFALALILIYGCGDRFDTSVFNAMKGNENPEGDTQYVAISPAWTGFNHPQAIYIGHEPLIYVADTDNDRVVMMNSAGEILSARSMRKPIAICQDYQLNLFVCAKDTLKITADSTIIVNAVFKLNLFASGHNLTTASIVRLLPDRSLAESLNPDYQYTGICAFYDNSLYIARSGPKNTSPYNPDNSILLFTKQVDGSHKFTERMAGLEPLGTGFRSVNGISSLTSFKKKNRDFVMTLIAPNDYFKTQWLYLNTSSENQKFESRIPGNTDMMTPNRFIQPEGSAIDDKGNIFIADAGTDSVYKFNSFGDELQSFGGHNVFSSPYSVAYDDKIVYVADTGNNRILRFILSTEIK